MLDQIIVVFSINKRLDGIPYRDRRPPPSLWKYDHDDTRWTTGGAIQTTTTSWGPNSSREKVVSAEPSSRQQEANNRLLLLTLPESGGRSVAVELLQMLSGDIGLLGTFAGIIKTDYLNHNDCPRYIPCLPPTSYSICHPSTCHLVLPDLHSSCSSPVSGPVFHAA